PRGPGRARAVVSSGISGKPRTRRPPAARRWRSPRCSGWRPGCGRTPTRCSCCCRRRSTRERATDGASPPLNPSADLRRRLRGRATALAVLLLALLPLPALADADVDPEALLREYADGNGGTPAVVALVIDRDPASGAYRQAVYTHGELDGRPPDRDTLFEIGSISKVFTSLLLADMVRRGEVRLHTTIGELADVALPEDVASITLQELSRHNSGLPRLPMSDGFWMRAVFRAEDPYAGTTREDLLRPLRKVDVGTRGAFAYSNFGVALLGQLLADRAGKPYRQLLEERVLRPHGMSGIYFDVASAPRDRL